MKTEYLSVTPRDPLIARDGRPFGAKSGNRMRSLDWFYPSVAAGALRTFVGKSLGGFSPEIVKKLKNISIAGPLPLKDGELYFPAPADFACDNEGAVYCARPLAYASGEGTDLPAGLIPLQIRDQFKPASSPAFWSAKKMVQWLVSKEVPAGFSGTEAAIDAPPKETRVHLEMNDDRGVGEDGRLFETCGLDFSRKESATPLQMAVKADTGEAIPEGCDTLGGERRLVEWKKNGSAAAWSCPQQVLSALAGAATVRLCLATPAIFSDGWKPGWVDSAGIGTVPGTQVRLKLGGAAVQRWQPISGWSLEAPVGPKAVRRMAPSGSTYFFEVVGGDPAELGKQWLCSVCDGEQDRRDGFGLALWGVW